MCLFAAAWNYHVDLSSTKGLLSASQILGKVAMTSLLPSVSDAAAL